MQTYDVEFRNVVKRYGDVIAVDNLSFRIESGKFLTLLGPSGCGKTTILRMIGGFEQPASGEIFLMGERMASEPPFRRNTNMVFQDYALFPHKTIGQNIGFGLKMRGAKKTEIEERVREMLSLINLPDIYDRRPHQLSGGQRQRVALVRALILKPPVLLLDEPLGALDAKIRKQLQLELKQLQRELGITFIYVTHDQEEAMTMSDIIAVLNEGKLEQLSSPKEVYEKPKTRFVAKFVGECNFFEGKIIGCNQSMIEIKYPGVGVFQSKYDISESTDLKGRRACLAIRPEDIEVGGSAKNCVNWLQGRLRDKLYTGSVMRLIIEINGVILTAEVRKGDLFSLSDNVQLGWNSTAGSVIID